MVVLGDVSRARGVARGRCSAARYVRVVGDDDRWRQWSVGFLNFTSTVVATITA
ncbi:MAG: hypothetical protein ACI93T_000901, partial [Porticoccaceae bacterium]